MRFIDTSQFSPPKGWTNRATAAAAAIDAEQDPVRRKKLIDSKAKVWSDLKSHLGKLSNKKCWYCESRQIRSDMHVDHFRPKGAFLEEGSEAHPGYWWLAFDWQNFRYSCTFCNRFGRDEVGGTSGGKGSRFPLRDQHNRCCTPGAYLGDEQPILLDPTNVADCALLWFDEDGTINPRYSCSQAPWPHRRAHETIQICHLDQGDLKEARGAVCAECKRLIAEGDEYYAASVQGSLTAQAKYETVFKRLRKLLLKSEEYSAAARATLMGLRSEHRPWVEEVLDSVSA